MHSCTHALLSRHPPTTVLGTGGNRAVEALISSLGAGNLFEEFGGRVTKNRGGMRVERGRKDARGTREIHGTLKGTTCEREAQDRQGGGTRGARHVRLQEAGAGTLSALAELV